MHSNTNIETKEEFTLMTQNTSWKMLLQTASIAAVFLMALLQIKVYGQGKSFFPAGNDPMTGGGQNQSQLPLTSLLAENRFPTDNIISAEHYYLGPGDLLVLQLVGALDGEFPLMVTPENTILVPRFGEVNVEGKTLAQVKEEVGKLATERNVHQKAYLSLQKARTVLVNIRGNVAQPGSYGLPASMRISTAVLLARRPKSGLEGVPLPGQLPKPFADLDYTLEPNSDVAFLSSPAARAIKVSRRDGTFVKCDLVRSRLLLEDEFDPSLREGDEIVVPFDNFSEDIVSISGEVERPSVLPFRRGDTYSLLLKSGFGLTEEADSFAIRLQLPEMGEQQLSWQELVARADAPLEAGTAIVVAKKENVKERKPLVVITGKVVKPGIYPIIPDSTRFSDIVEMAGGLALEEAYLPLSRIERRKDSLFKNGLNAERAMRLFQYSNMGGMDSMRFKIDVLLPPEKVAADLTKAFDTIALPKKTFPFGWIGGLFRTKKQDSLRLDALRNKHNPKLEAGDIITIAENPRTVMVFGQVNNPGYVPFQEDMPLSWYIRTAGGKGDFADAGRTRIIKGGSNVWMEVDTPIQAGDRIYVPAEPDVPPGMDLQYYSILASIISTTAFFASTLINILNR